MTIPQEVTDEIKRREAEYYLNHLTPSCDFKDGFLACWEWMADVCVHRTELDKLQVLVDYWYAKANGDVK